MDIRQSKTIALFVGCAAVIFWVAVTEAIPASWEMLRFGLLAALFLVSRILFFRNIASPTPSGAIVMAIGIFINGAIMAFSTLDALARSFTLVLLVLFLFILASYVLDLIRGRVYTAHFADTVGRFAVGTWIAGTSVCGVALCQRLPEWKPLVQVMVVGNIGLWLYFVFRALQSFLQLLPAASKHNVHGVLFLSTVSTQSLVIVWKAAFGESSAYLLIAPWAIGLGVVLYCISFYLIARRYVRQADDFDVDRDWFNTNCITHGAMSITGLASVVSGVVPTNFILLIWLWTISWFLIIETIEVVRAVKRVSRHGLAGGVLVYDPTQWSRNFTFGMLYAFTMNVDLGQTSGAGSLLLSVHHTLISFFPWVVLVVLLIEIAVFLCDRLSPVAASPAMKS
jgi:hypothetical protein